MLRLIERTGRPASGRSDRLVGLDADADLAELRRRHRADLSARLPVLIDRLSWPRDRLAAWRRRRIRDLVRTALDAPWHRDRLGSVDLDAFGVDELETLPVMSKADMMDNLDGALTDPRLTRARLEEHLVAAEDNPYLLGTYHVLASGGSSGVRGVYVYDWDAWIDYCGAIMRWRAARGDATPGVVARVSADKVSHASGAISATMHDPAHPSARLPVTLPVDEIVSGLNRAQPAVLMGYPSALAELAAEAGAGRLAITPRLVIGHSEPLLPEVRQVLEAAWRTRVENSYGTSEGAFAYSCPNGRGMHLADDLAIVELVNEDGEAVAAGTPSSKIYVTNLFNRTQPFIRFELSDQLTEMEGSCGCGSSHTWIEEPVGRYDDVFVYPDSTRIHPLVFRSPLGRTAGITEYQVVQTATGADVVIVGDPSLSCDQIAEDLSNGLRSAGLAHPLVTVRLADRLERLPSGKVRRFVPLSSETGVG
jgi:phenylacetate-coenzyme A ligase PaaK-like adenylate-forming protein